MGQVIEVQAAEMGDVVIFTTDRSVTGQDGASYPSAAAANEDVTFPGLLASRLYEGDASLTSIFVASNAVVARRDGGWDEPAITALSRVISDFFLFYPAE